MWKVVFRGIRETLERRVCRTNVYSQSSQDNAKNEVKTSLTCQQKFLPPIFITCDKSFCGSAKSTGAKDKKYEWNTKHSWPEAFGWSSVLAAGLIVCQTLCFRKRIFDRDSNETLKNKLCDYSGVSFILTQLLNFKPRNILPVTNCIGNSDTKSKPKDSDSQWAPSKPFGPITIEEAFKEAADEFANTHKLVVGEYEFRYGIKALQEKRYDNALMHFSAGANLSSPGSMFNLGLCHELGIGTLVDQKKAVKYYNDAAAHDHADALYNLGVFHAQGRGGLKIDIDVARSYFIRAAKLGQVQAQHALDLEKAGSLKKNNNASIVPNKRLTNEENLEIEKNKANDEHMKLNDYMLKTNIEKILSTNFTAKCTLEAAKYKETVQDPTQVFLDFLGLGESNQAPIAITTNDCHVPC